MPRTFATILPLLAASALLVACSSESPTAGSASGAPSTSTGSGAPSDAPTFHRDIEPLLQRSCMGCHSEGNIGPFDMTTYEGAKPYAELMAQETASRTMPPWGAQDTDECHPRFGWADDERMNDEEIALLRAWADAGAPEGDPADAPDAFAPKPPGLSGIDIEVAPLAPYVTSGNSDEMRCFVLDPKITADTFINGMGVVAGNPKVVHHVLVYSDPDAEGDALADENGSYPCFGGPGISKSTLAAAWAPGAQPTDLPENVGMRVKAGTKFIMQVHYHPAGQTGDPDLTKFQIRFGKGAPEYNYAVALVGNFGSQGQGLLPGPNDDGKVQFRIPAGVKGHTETMELHSPQDVPALYIYGVGTHMHYVGTDMKVEIEHVDTSDGQPAKECLVQTPAWNFEWQRLYRYDVDIESLPRAMPGDKSTYRCTYDNTMENRFVAQALKDQQLSEPHDVFLGEETLDEMCLGVFALLYKGSPLDF